MQSFKSSLWMVMVGLVLAGCGQQAANGPKGGEDAGDAVAAATGSVLANYADLVHANYADAHADAVKLAAAIDTLVAKPNKKNLAAAKQAWLQTRESYGQTEAFRFYEGPIDFANPDTGEEGPEGQLNAWPLNEAFIDYVEGNPKAGIIQNTSVPITRQLLVDKNAAEDEADVTTGYHAVEFLLWGQDHSADGPGARPITDLQGEGEIAKRRRQYLKIVTDLIVDDLAGLVAAWAPGKDNYRTQFVASDPQETLGHLMTSLATLSAFELASERLAVAIRSGDQEDEHSCFSDNTHRDFVANTQGIDNVFNGRYGKTVVGPSLRDLIALHDAELAARTAKQIARSVEIARSIQGPIDQALAGNAPAELKKMNQLVDSLQKQADLLIAAGKPLGVTVEVLAE